MRTPTRIPIFAFLAASSALACSQAGASASNSASYPSLFPYSLAVHVDRPELATLRRRAEATFQAPPGASSQAGIERLSRMSLGGAPASTPLWNPGSSRRLVHVGVQALALYTYARIHDGEFGPDPYGLAGSARELSRRADALGDVSGEGSVVVLDVTDGGAVALASERRGEPGIALGPVSLAKSPADDSGDPDLLVRTPIGIVNRVEGHVLEVMSALRAAHLNQFPLSRDLSLKLDARTGRRSHFFAVVSHRF